MNLLKRFFMFVVITTVSIFTLIGCSFSTNKKPLSIEMEGEIWAGVEYDLVVNITAGDASSVEWSIDNGKVATFQNGKLIGLEEGSFNLTAKLGDDKDVCHIVVKEAAVYNVSYVLFGGSENAEEPLVRTVYEYTEATALTSPVKEGYVFQGYYTNESFEGEPVTSISGEVGQDITLYAKWEVIEYTTSYDLAGGKLPEGVVLPEVRTIDSVAFTLPELTKEGYTFAGWFTADGEEVKYVGSENLHIDALYAKFEAIEYEITYELNGGTNSDSNPSKYTCEQKVEFAAPSKFGYKFVGWEVEGKQVEGIEAGSMGAVHAVAKWEVVSLVVEFELNGGALAEGVVLPTSRTVEDAPYVLPTELSKLGHNFIGWFDNAECKGEKITQLDETNVKVSKFYAGFEEVRYNISYELNGGANDAANPDSYLYGIAVELKPATKEHYEFVEWQLNGVAVEEVAAGTLGEVKLVAVWKAIEYTVSIDNNDGTEYREPMTLDEFADMIVKDFNSTGMSDAVTTTKESFKSTSHPNIKYVFDDAEMLAKYKWFFQFAIDEMTRAAELNGKDDYLADTVAMLQAMIDGDTTVIAAGSNADERTAFRWLIEGLLNRRLSTGTGLYNQLMIDYSKEENVARFTTAQGSGMPTIKLTVESELPTPVREHYEFLGWYENGVKVEKISGETTLVAEWKAVEYDVELDFAGGQLEGVNLDAFADELVKDFNSTGKSDAVTTTKESFKSTSHPNIKYVFADAAMLAKYKWFFQFAIEEMTKAAELNGKDDYLADTVAMLQAMIDGDTTAAGLSSNADERTAFRWLIEGLLNRRLSTGTGLYNQLMIDYSKEENVARFEEALAAPYAAGKYTVEDKLFNLVREGYIFQGWYNEQGEKVETIKASQKLVAKWEIIKFEIEYELNEGSWAEGQEGVNQFDWGTVVTLPTPVREGYEFLGWIENFEYVTEIENRDYVLVAKWKDATQTGYEVIFDLNGGSWGKDLSTFADELIKDFNSTGKSDAKVTTKNEFRATSHPNIKYVFADAEMLAKYKWLFEFAKAEITAAAGEKWADETHFKNTILMLDGMIAGDTNAVNINDGGNARTAFRWWVEGLINERLSTGTGSYDHMMVDYSQAANMNRFIAVYCPVEVTVEPNETLPTPVREHYFFDGWYVDGVKVEFATGDDVLVAGWIHEDDYEWTVEFDLNGGAFEGATLDKFADEIVGDFNKYGGSTTETTKENFKGTSHPQIKTVFAMPEMLAKYKWFFEFAVEEITLAAGEKWADEEIYKNTMIMLNGMIAGDTNAVNINDGGNARTAFRYWVEGLLNEKLPTGTGSYDHLMVDYSNAENMSRFMAVYTAASQDVTFTAKDVLPTPVKENNKFLGWAHEGVIIEQVRGNWKLVAQWLDYATVKYSISYELDGGSWKEGETPVTEFGWNEEVTLLEPVKEGYKFLGWYEDKQAVSSIGNKDYTLVAKWEEVINEDEAKTLYVDPENPEHYATLADALEAARTGDTIVMVAGNFEPAEITKGIKLLGANAGINPNKAERGAETQFTSDLVVSANNVLIDGIKLTGDGRIVGNAETGVSNLTITNVVVPASTTNPSSAFSTTAPITLFSNTPGAYFENIVLNNLRYTESVGRPMILYGAQIINLQILNSYFESEGAMGNYNDAIKIDNAKDAAGNFTCEFGIKGDVAIKGNHFEDYHQYVIWFIDYQEGNYEILDNTFKNNGQTASSHCAVRFQSYSGAEDGKVNIEFGYNTVDNSYSLIRFDAAANRTEDNTTVKVNYNKLLNCAATYFVNNKLTFAIDATNNYYGFAPDANKFLNAIWEPYISNEKDIPEYVDEENSVKIDYVLNGGTLPEGAEEYYNRLLGISSLIAPTYENHIFLGWYYNDKLVTSLEAGLEGEVQLVAKWREDALYVGEGDEDWIYATIAEALAAAKEGDKIILLPGTYNEDITISTNGLTIAGPNQGINAVTGTRGEEATITGKVTVAAGVKGLTIDGIALSGAATITGTQVINFTFKNNFVHDTNAPSGAWAESNAYKSATINFITTTGKESKNVQFLDNYFKNVQDVNVNFTRVTNVSYDGNKFHNFGYDAIRFNDGGYNSGLLSFTNNEFVQDTLGGYNGIFFRIYGGSGQDTEIVVKNNRFVNIGTESAGLYSNAISARNYQEKGAYFTISNNYFEGCLNYIRLRNNATAANHAASEWEVTIELNQFIGLPKSYYFASRNGTSGDNDSTAPLGCIFGANYYTDKDGNVITDLTQYESYFVDVLNKGTALEKAPEASDVEGLEFYSISYDLNGGSTYESFVYEYSSAIEEAIALPQLTLVNHQFMGWLLNGELVTEISVETRGNLHLVAEFKVLEGELYDITFVNEKEFAVWPSRGAVGREEIIAELMSDLYEWAQSNGETRSFADYEADIKAKIAAYSDIKLRNTELGNYPAEDGSTEYFFNVPKYYQKWNEFFAIFNEAMLAVNSGQVFYSDTYAAMVRLAQFIAWSSTGQSYFTSFLGRMCAATKVPQEIPTQYRGGQILELPQLSMENGLEFLGWYDNPEFTGEAITSITALDTGAKTFYAKWAPEVKAEKLEINKVTEMLLFTTHQFVWSITPDNTTDKSVEFFSSNEAVATVSSKGLVTALSLGTTTITVKVYGNRDIDLVYELTVYSNDYIDASYAEESYAKVNETVQLLAQVVKKDGTIGGVNWTSATPEIATVDGNGLVTALRPGQAKIVATDAANPELSVEFFVTVLEENTSEALDFIINSHEDNIFTRYNLGIGSGIPEYYKDIFGSVSKLLYNYDYQVDTSRKDTEVNTNTGDYYLDMTSVEFITVHYTGNMSLKADGKANANYFVGDNSVSIHYTTGNDGIYQCLDHKDGAWHAGDSGAMDVVGAFEWMPTGVMVGENDPQYPVFTISDDFYYEINGYKTSVEMAKPWDYSGRGTDHILNADGTISSQSDFGQSGFTGRAPESFINDMGLPFMIQDGQYYMGTTWWCYTQVYEGRICSTGGNRNSVGIESCVDKGSDLWYTWQITAQLVARLMVELELDITRVRGHHFFSGKDCPQPMLANDCEIWNEFKALILAEYELITKYADYEITFESHNPDIIDNNGRVIAQPSETTCVSYTITLTKDGVSESVTLSSMVKGLYVDR